MSRPKGSPNRFTADLRGAIARAFHNVGGHKYVARLASTRPDLFVALVAKVVPKELHATFTARYEAIQIRTEAREPIPGQPALPAPAAVVDVPFTATLDEPSDQPLTSVSETPLTADDL